jgi:diguanylate cyclase (GGDEF)-like protein
MFRVSAISSWLGRSLTRKLVLLLLGFLALQAIQLSVGIFSLRHLDEEAGLINDAGKQRMRLLLMRHIVHEASMAGRWEPGQWERLDGLIAEQEATYVRLHRHTQEAFHAYLGETLARAIAHWEKKTKPLLAALDPTRQRVAHDLYTRFDRSLPDLIVLEDRVVQEFQANASNDARDLAAFQMVMFGLNLLLGGASIILFRRGMVRPLRDLAAVTNRNAAGAYDGRVATASRDEIGQLAETFNRMTNAVAEKTRRLTALNRMAGSITSSLKQSEVLDQIMYHATDLSGAAAACIAFYDQKTALFNEWVTHGLSDHFVRSMAFGPGGLADETFTTGTHVLSNDLPGTRHQLSRLARDEGIRSFICLPLTSGKNRLGVIYFYRKDSDLFAPDDISLLQTFAHLAAGVLENARLYARAEAEARIDALTGLANRRSFDRRLAAEHSRASRYSKPYALAILDIDHFKRVNDQRGHPAGDAVLAQLGQVLTRQFRDVDVVARYGGEEFAVILPEISGSVAKVVAERARRAIAATPFALPDGRMIGVTVSIGVSSYPNCATSPESAVSTADQALYIAKQAGRNRVLLYRETLKARIEKNPDLIAALLNENPDNVLPVVTAVAAKALFLRTHVDKVVETAALLAQALGLSTEERAALRLAAELHDIGMAAIPDALLAKTTPLTPEEWEIIKQHPATGAAYLERVPELRHLASLVRHHHERYDGAGYPDGLKGEAMPRLARVLAVADAYGSMVSDWPGHAAVPAAQAKARLKAGAGTQFDPEMVNVLLRVLEEGTV